MQSWSGIWESVSPTRFRRWKPPSRVKRWPQTGDCIRVPILFVEKIMYTLKHRPIEVFQSSYRVIL